MKYLNQEIENELRNQGAELIRFVDISHLSETQNRQFAHKHSGTARQQPGAVYRHEWRNRNAEV